MAKLKASKRNKLADSSFGLPEKRKFPMNDTVHQQKAIQLAPRSLHAGNISEAEEHKIVAKAKRLLHGGNAMSAAKAAMKRKRG